MNTYLFYTDEGFTMAPNGEELENLQVLGFEKAICYQKALDNLFSNNGWIKSMGFTESQIKCHIVLK